MWLEAVAALIHTPREKNQGRGMRKFIIANLLTIALVAPSPGAQANWPVPRVWAFRQCRTMAAS